MMGRVGAGSFIILCMTWQLCDASHSTHVACKVKGSEVDCSDKKLNNMPDLHKHSNASILLLNGNKIAILESKSFAATPNLTKINITRNHLKTINDQSFVGLKSLSVLDLSNNLIKQLSDKVFGADLSNLRILYLENNNLTKISQNMFDKLTKLTSLHLEHNKLISIHKHSFNKLHAITLINIDHNSLNNVSADWFKPVMKHLNHVAMKFNPWICDARVCNYSIWLRNFTKEQAEISNMLAIPCCHEKDATVKNIPQEIFCHSQHHNDRHIKLIPNSHATLQCHDTKSTSWTVMTMRKSGKSACHRIIPKSNERITITQGKLQIKGAQKTDAGRYCCVTHDSAYSKCITLKLTTKNTSSGGSGVTAAICIVVFILVIGGVFCFCRRKRRNYGVLRDEGIPPTSTSERFTESSNFSQHSATTADQPEVDEAYV